MRRPAPMIALVALAILLTSLGAPARRASGLQRASDAITSMDVEDARELLKAEQGSSRGVATQRARLSLLVGDCDSAEAVLQAHADHKESRRMLDLARRCARAVAGALVVEDDGVWVRLQDDRDRALVPYIATIARAARASIERDLGVRLPLPVRIDLVRDLFSLAAISGLPLEAAETTGTVAVARWGKVTMLSPRAASGGYPWQDTLTHELTHLALSRATLDYAPLWLQEGLAKRQETRWRLEQPFDDHPPADSIARSALLDGTSVGVDKLGPSIAMLPTPGAAQTAFAEVASFIDYWIKENGVLALHLLLRDLRGLRQKEAGAALSSVSGYPLGSWILMWQQALLTAPPALPPEDVAEPRKPAARATQTRHRSGVQRARLGDLLAAQGARRAALTQFEANADTTHASSPMRARAAQMLLELERFDDAGRMLGEVSEVDSLHSGWLAMHGRFLKHMGKVAEAERDFRLGVSLDPLSERVACEGYDAPSHSLSEREAYHAAHEPLDPPRRALCEAARKIPRD